MATFKFTSDHATAIVCESEYLVKETKMALRDYQSLIESELDIIAELRDSDSDRHATLCLLFAMISPQCPFDVNVRQTYRMYEHLGGTFDNVNDVYQCLTDGGSDATFTSGMAARGIFASLDILRTASADIMSKSALQALRKVRAISGLGDKTMSMAVALFDSTANVFTLDVHMLRGLLRGIGVDITQGVVIGTRDYVNIENWAIDTLRKAFPQVDIFTTQWALWNMWGFDTHKCHTDIFGYVGTPMG